jgi:hypothetical protein
MRKISREEYERWKKLPKREILEELLPFVQQQPGRKPEFGERALTPYEKLKRFRAKQKELEQAKIETKARKRGG